MSNNSHQADPNLMTSEKREAKLLADHRKEVDKGIINGPAADAHTKFTEGLRMGPVIDCSTAKAKEDKLRVALGLEPKWNK